MVGHNKIISKNHFHKDWQKTVRINFDQPFKKLKRNKSRVRKALQLAPAPIHLLRPIIRCPTFRYNLKQRLGRGFSLAEIHAAKLTPKYARSIGIAVDHRRRNKSYESLLINKHRLQQYIQRLVLFPNGRKKMQERTTPTKEYTPIVNITPIAKGKIKHEKTRCVTEDEKKFQAFLTLRMERGRVRAVKNKRKKLSNIAVLE